jgi:uncharacterized protein
VQPRDVELILDLDAPEDPEALRLLAAERLGVAPDRLPSVHVKRRALDARRGRVRVHLRVGLGPDSATEEDLGAPHPREVRGEPRVVIVGDGPAGLFCAYGLARAGIPCVVLDRGKPVQPRRRDLAALNRQGVVDTDSNYCFGEGGAGTYSDGKLYTRALKRGDARDVLDVLALHGAPADILTDARPHIGSNRLPRVVTALRERLEGVGVQVRFGARVTGLIVRQAGARRAVAGVRLADGSEVGADFVVLATGHSARDVHDLLEDAGVRLEPKPFALGVRIEHPQPLVDRIQYGAQAGHPKLPAAAYRVATTVRERGVFSFCMCPGGWIVPAATAPGELVVNGMSLSKRDSPYANAGLVVAVEPEDWTRAGHGGPAAGWRCSAAVERAAFEAGGGAQRAPATRVPDFLAGRGSTTVPGGSYVPGFCATDVAEVLDGAGVPLAARLREALGQFGRRMRGYVTAEAVLVGVESRTSSPVRVPRDPDSLQSTDLDGLYPAGEGAGYAGGIVSAAMDGARIARKITEAMAATPAAR